MPRALDEFHEAVASCVKDYQEAFGKEAADLFMGIDKIRVTVRTQQQGKWETSSKVEVLAVPSIPGFQIDRGNGSEPLIIEVGILPGDKLFFRDRALDQYITMDDLTRRTLDRGFFPKLEE